MHRNNSLRISQVGEGTECTHPQRYYNRTCECFNAKDLLQHTCIKTVKSQWKKRLSWWVNRRICLPRREQALGWSLVGKDSTHPRVTKPGTATAEPAVRSPRSAAREVSALRSPWAAVKSSVPSSPTRKSPRRARQTRGSQQKPLQKVTSLQLIKINGKKK